VDTSAILTLVIHAILALKSGLRHKFNIDY